MLGFGNSQVGHKSLKVRFPSQDFPSTVKTAKTSSRFANQLLNKKSLSTTEKDMFGLLTGACGHCMNIIRLYEMNLRKMRRAGRKCRSRRANKRR